MDGKRILVIGASSGVGAAVARLADDQDARVVISARRADVLEAMASRSKAMVSVPGDVRDETEASSIVEQTVEVLGGLDAVVYAVGISPLQPLAGATAAQWRDVLDTNVIGAAMVSAAAAPYLLASQGRLILLSSKSVRKPFPHLALYATSKFALDGLIQCLPVEFPGLRVARVLVGNTGQTDFTASWDPEALGEALVQWEAAGLLGDGDTAAMAPDDVAASVCHVITSPAHIDDISVLDHP